MSARRNRGENGISDRAVVVKRVSPEATPLLLRSVGPGVVCAGARSARSRGQRGAPDWTNDVDAGDDRRRLSSGPRDGSQRDDHHPNESGWAGRYAQPSYRSQADSCRRCSALLTPMSVMTWFRGQRTRIARATNNRDGCGRHDPKGQPKLHDRQTTATKSWFPACSSFALTSPQRGATTRHVRGAQKLR